MCPVNRSHCTPCIELHCIVTLHCSVRFKCKQPLFCFCGNSATKTQSNNCISHRIFVASFLLLIHERLHCFYPCLTVLIHLTCQRAQCKRVVDDNDQNVHYCRSVLVPGISLFICESHESRQRLLDPRGSPASQSIFNYLAEITLRKKKKKHHYFRPQITSKNTKTMVYFCC